MFRYYLLVITFTILGCSTDALSEANSLSDSLLNKEIVRDNVIACAASDADDATAISVFFYPRPGVSNVRYFETEDASFDKNDLNNYTPVSASIEDVFNGYLKKFVVVAKQEKWGIVSFEEDGKTHLSNPIRLKQVTKPTEYLPQNSSIDTTSIMPNFSWKDGSYDDTKIYFQVISDEANNLLSGTYTFEKNFQFYKLENVVLNITRVQPSNLEEGRPYRFTLLAVSEDNWVNLFSEKAFVVSTP